MPAIHEIATLTSKGQVTLPKSVRQLLGIDTGGKIAFDVRGGEIVVSRVETTHEDPASVRSWVCWRLISEAAATSPPCRKTWRKPCSPTRTSR